MKDEFNDAIFKDLGLSKQNSEIYSHLITIREVKIFLKSIYILKIKWRKV